MRAWPLPAGFDYSTEHCYELRAVGAELSIRIDEQVVGTVRDDTIQEAGEMGVFVPLGLPVRSIKSLRLDPPALPVSPVADATAIKLWDAPEKIVEAQRKGTDWQDGVIRLDSAALYYFWPESRDAVIRAAIQMDPATPDAQIAVRCRSGNQIDDRYVLVIESGSAAVLCSVTAGRYEILKRWDLPRKYRPGEWATVELRAVATQLSASIDGAVLGTVESNLHNEPGGVCMYARANGRFRDVAYTPLVVPGPSTRLRSWRSSSSALRPCLGLRLISEPPPRR